MIETTAESSSEAIVPFVVDTLTEDHVSVTVTNLKSLSYQSHVKSLKGIKNKDFEKVVEKLSKRYRISDHLKIKMFEVKTKNQRKGEYRLEGEKYFALAIKREDELDILIINSQLSLSQFSLLEKYKFISSSLFTRT